MPRRVKRAPPRSEASIERAHCGTLEAAGFRCWKQSGLGRRSRPDRLLLSPRGHACFVEWKRPGAAPTRAQADELDGLEASGFQVAACDDAAAADDFVADVLDDRRKPWRARWAATHTDGPPLPPPLTRGWRRG